MRGTVGSENPWIESLGGLYICLPEDVRHAWRGGVEDEDEEDSEESTDYWQAGLGGGLASTFPVSGSQALVLAAGKGPLTYVPHLDLFVQRMAKTSAADVVGAVARALPAVRWETAVEWNAGNGLVVFDAVWAGEEVPADRLLRVDRPAGLTRVDVAQLTPTDEHDVWVTLYRLEAVPDRLG
ncbi:Imm21 family immunity protein [Streptomyces flaveolus]|uniref:Imm21 family immunity protein n=1 Tax=Streptomyces flaveolus TaxID=67297 RepID=UPI0034333EFD